MNLADEVEMLMTQLILAWGSVNLEGTGKVFTISNADDSVAYSAPTMLAALRLAAEDVDDPSCFRTAGQAVAALDGD